MKVLYVTKNMPFGAAEAFIFAEVEDHIANGWDVHIAPVQQGPLIHKRGKALLEKTMKKGLLDGDILWGALSEFLRQPVTVVRLFGKILTHGNLKVLPRNMAVFAKGIWLGRQSRKLGIAHIHIHWIAVPATMGLIAARIARLPMSITAHRYDIAQNNLIDEKFAASSFVRAIDVPGAQELRAQSPRALNNPIIIRMGVEIAASEKRPKPDKVNPIRAIIGARFVPKKGHETLIKAVASARGRGLAVQLDMYGDGPLEEPIRKLVKSLGVDDIVIFKGVASHEELLSYVRSGHYDVAVLPSVTAKNGDKEGIPVFLMEAMAAHLPVISTPNGGITELIDDQSGILVEEYDAEALALAFISLAESPAERTRLAENGYRKVLDEFGIVACAQQLRDQISAPALRG